MSIEQSPEKYGRLKVIGSDPDRKFRLICECECGTIRSFYKYDVTHGKSRSCGCLKMEILIKRSTTHGLGNPRNPEWRSWCSMKQRCLNPSDPGWKDYGGRGITIYPPWIDDFLAFYKHIGPHPGPGYTLDRINVNGNYEPGNVKWSTKSEQTRNRRPRFRSNGLPVGVRFKKSYPYRPYCAVITTHGRRTYLGAFATVEEARVAYLGALEKVQSA